MVWGPPILGHFRINIKRFTNEPWIEFVVLCPKCENARISWHQYLQKHGMGHGVGCPIFRQTFNLGFQLYVNASWQVHIPDMRMEPKHSLYARRMHIQTWGRMCWKDFGRRSGLTVTDLGAL